MKKLYNLLAVLMIFWSTANISAQCLTAPFTESFDTGLQPNCVLISATSGGPWDFNGIFWNTSGCSTAPTDHTGNNGDFASMDHSGTDVGVIMELDTIDVSSLTNPYLEFYYFMCGVGYSPVNILAVETFDGTGWVGVDTIQQGTSGWQLFAYDLSSNTFGTNFLKVRFRAESGGSGIDFYGDQAIDDISISELPSCFKPLSLTASNVTSTSLDLGWTDPNSASNFEIEYDTAGFVQGTATATIVTANPTSITGLTPNTQYDFYVRAICGAADTSAWSSAGSFRTSCSPFTATYSQNFDGTIDPAIDACWSVLNTTTSTGWVETENSTSDPQRSAPNAIEFYNAGASTGNLLLVSPRFSDLDNTKQIRFWLQDEGSTAYTSDLIVGTMSDPLVDTTFEPYDTIPNAFFAFNTWTEFTINFSNLTNGDKHVAFRHGLNGTFDYIFMDDFVYELAPSCPTPSFLAADTITSSSAYLAWTENGSATTWEIEWDTAGFAQGTGNTVITTNNPFQITGLNPATAYDFYVRSICGVNDTSAWSNVATFNSAIQGPQGFTCTVGAPSIIFVDDFESNSGWTGNIGTGTTASNWNFRSGGTGSTGTGPNGAHSGTQYVYVETSGAGVGDTASFISPAISLVSGSGSAELSFWVHAIGAQIGTLNVDVATSITGPYTTLFSYSGAIQAAQADPFMNVGVNLDAYVGQTIYVRYNYITNGSFAGDIAIDLMEISTCTNCPSPSNLNVNTGLTTADLGWTENGSATTWEIEWDTAGFTQGTGTNVVVTSNPYSLTGLTSNSSYEYYVRSICGPGDTSLWSVVGSFNTLIGLPFNEDWETTPYPWSSTATGNPQWLFGGTTGSTGTGPAADHTTGTGTFSFLETSGGSLGNTDTLISNEIITGAGDSLLEFSFWYHMHGSSMGDLQAWIFGRANGPTLMTTISGQQQVNQTDPWLNFTSLLSGYENDTVRIVFVGVRGSSFTSDMGVDDISLDLPPADNLAVTAITSPGGSCGLTSTETVTITINNLGSATQTGFDVAYQLNGVAITPETFTGSIGAGQSATYSFTTTADLSVAGPYTIQAYTQLVGDADPTNDSSAINLNSVASATLPYAESFESGAAGWLVEGTTTFALGAPAGTIIDTASDGTQAWVTNLTGNYNVNESGWVSSPCFDFSSMIEPVIELDIWYDAETSWDGAVMQASIDGGSTWFKIGADGDTVNWYNDNTISGLANIEPSQEGWTGSPGSLGWLNAKRELDTLAGQPSVRLRVAFGSDGSVVNEGFAFDNVRIFDNFVPPVIPYYPIGTINTVDANGVADSLNVRVMTSGTVAGVDLDGNNGLNFYIIDMSSGFQEGISVFNFNDVSNYVVNEGDSIMIIGDVDQFNGQQQIFVDSILLISSGAFLPSPRLVTNLDETTEANLIELRDLRLLDGSQTFSYNMDATNGTDTITIRVDSDTDVNDSLNINPWVAGDTICSIIGVGGQFDNSSPYTSGYQIFPMRFSDIDTATCQITSITEVQGAAGRLSIYPNPTNDVVTITANGMRTNNARLMVRDITGKIIFEERLNSGSGFTQTLDFSDRANGVYFITIIDGDDLIHEKLIKN